jgi:hypothetical protein
MSKNRRIFFELLVPPFLATIWLLITSSKSETISDAILGFVPLLLFAYMFGIIPAILYTVAMELWFRFGLRVRCGLLCTVGLSAFLGAVAGFLSAGIGALLGFLIWPDCIHFLWIGAVVGLLVGFFVGRSQTAGSDLK